MMDAHTQMQTAQDPAIPELDKYEARSKMDTLKRLSIQYRVLEFTVAVVMMVFAGVFAIIPVYMRAIPHIEIQLDSGKQFWARDPNIDQKKMPQHVPMDILVLVGIGLPALTNLFMNYALPNFKRVAVVAHDTRDFMLSLAISIGISQLLTQYLKNMTGRFRPCFYDMCGWAMKTKWDGVENLCQDKSWEQEARKSFPSGHSSFSWATLFLLTLYLMGRSRLNVENRSETFFRGGRKSIKLFLCFAPTLLAAWITVTRSIDNWHHYSDILTGSCIGALAASIAYFYNYGSIFSWNAAGIPYQEYHRLRKLKHESEALGKRSTPHVPIPNDNNLAFLRSGAAAHVGVQIQD